MRFLVLGAGALGSYFGAALIRGGAEVAFLVRPARAAQLAARGLAVSSPEGDFRGPVRSVTTDALDGVYGAVLLACKAYDLEGALAALAPALGRDSAVLPVLNGVRHVEVVAERLGAQHVLGGMTTVNAVVSPNGEVARSAHTSGRTVFGEVSGAISPRCRAIEAAFAAGGVAVSPSPRILDEMWEKFAAFAAIASIAVLSRATAGEIAALPAGSGFVEAALAESRRLVEALGHSVTPVVNDFVTSLYRQIGSAYRPSMLVDIAAGRPTEGEHIFGDLVRRAGQIGMAVPILQAALCSVQIYESRRASGDQQCHI